MYEVLVSVWRVTERRNGQVYKTVREGVKWVDWDPNGPEPERTSGSPDIIYASPSDKDYKEAGIEGWQTPRRKAR